jgi:uncharacterized membrane protein YjjP (DUF1212 family)
MDATPADLPAIVSPRPYPAAEFHFLQLAARLMLEYNFRTELVKTKLLQAAKRLGVDVLVFVAYRGVTLYSPEGHQFHAQASELRINVAVSAQVNHVLQEFVAGKLSLAASATALESVEQDAPQHDPWALAFTFGLAASALAWLLRADAGAVAVSGVSSALGLVARQELARRRAILPLLPFTAALMGAVLGGVVIRLGWTATPGSCLMVPALMLVPGPHLINGLYDMLENHMQTGLSRLGLAAVILAAAALGVSLGGWITVGTTTVSATPAEGVVVTFALDLVLAGMASCGFGASYNAPWRMIWISILCGMVGHGIRFLCLRHGISIEIATLFACLAIGWMAGVAVERLHVPFAAVAFAGAVPMMPGTSMYQGLAGTVLISKAGVAAGPVLLASTFSNLFNAGFVVGAMALGLLVGGRMGSVLPVLRPK